MLLPPHNWIPPFLFHFHFSLFLHPTYAVISFASDILALNETILVPLFTFFPSFFLFGDEEMYKYAAGGFPFHLFSSSKLWVTPKIGFSLGGEDV